MFIGVHRAQHFISSQTDGIYSIGGTSVSRWWVETDARESWNETKNIDDEREIFFFLRRCSFCEINTISIAK